MSRIMFVNPKNGHWVTALIGRFEGDVAEIPPIQKHFEEEIFPVLSTYWQAFFRARPEFYLLVMQGTENSDPNKVVIMYVRRDGRPVNDELDELLSGGGIQEVDTPLDHLEEWAVRDQGILQALTE